ncbi:hypothetical protein BS17DRAFT_137654 [Gyrodon lividus]|nr:hypothetical protein BS17DRAFT_137654 [Gyrodon lividus]
MHSNRVGPGVPFFSGIAAKILSTPTLRVESQLAFRGPAPPSYSECTTVLPLQASHYSTILLQKLAHRGLSICANSASTKRLSSNFGTIPTKLCSRISLQYGQPCRTSPAPT